MTSAIQTALGQWLWYLGFPLVPMGICVIGLTRYDVLHSTYLLLTLGLFCVAAVNFQPSIYQAFLGCPQHMVVRGYASAHVALLYAALLIGMPGLDGLLPEGWRPWLQALGLWRVSVVNAVLPLTALVLVVCRKRGGLCFVVCVCTCVFALVASCVYACGRRRQHWRSNRQFSHALTGWQIISAPQHTAWRLHRQLRMLP